MSDVPACVFILRMKGFVRPIIFGLIAIGLMSCGGSSPDDNRTSTNEKTNISSGDISISVTPTTDISSSKQGVLSDESSKSTTSYTIKPDKSGKLQDNGKLKEEGGAYFLDNSPFTGDFIDHHDNGNKSLEGKFLNGKQEGVWAYYHKNGNRFRTGKYLNGRANGQWVIWRMDGSKWSEKNYVNGQLNGIETRWHPNGQKQSETEWGGGKILSKKEWDESGTSKP